MEINSSFIISIESMQFIYLDDDKLFVVNEWIENAHLQAFI